MEYDSFSEGVELGGLRTKNEIKILIGYLLSRLDTPLKREQLDEIISLKAIGIPGGLVF